MKRRKRQHHNKHGRQQIKSGNVRRNVRIIARKLKIPYKRPRRDERNDN